MNNPLNNPANTSSGMTETTEEGSRPMLRLGDVEKSFAQGKSALHVLRGASLTINAGEMVALVGPSGSGKSTLLNIAGLLENPDRGAVQVGGPHTARVSSKERAKLRRQSIGFVFQFHRF